MMSVSEKRGTRREEEGGACHCRGYAKTGEARETWWIFSWDMLCGIFHLPQSLRRAITPKLYRVSASAYPLWARAFCLLRTLRLVEGGFWKTEVGHNLVARITAFVPVLVKGTPGLVASTYSHFLTK